MSGLNEAQFQELARDAYSVDWIAAACITCLLYDHLLTLGAEITCMWPARLSIPKVLFFINRYGLEALLVFNSIASARNDLSYEFCRFFLRWLSCTLLITNAIVDGILVIRVCALYHSNWYIQGLALFFYVGGVCAHVGLTIQDYVGEAVLIVTDLNVLPGCYAASVPAMIAGYWITPVIVESSLFVLIASKAFLWWRKKSAPPVLLLLARDSAIYFSLIFCFLMANLFLLEYGPPSLDSLLLTPSNTVGCIAGSRMLLNLRGIATKDYEESQLGRGIRLPRPPKIRVNRVPETIQISSSNTVTTTDYPSSYIGDNTIDARPVYHTLPPILE